MAEIFLGGKAGRSLVRGRIPMMLELPFCRPGLHAATTCSLRELGDLRKTSAPSSLSELRYPWLASTFPTFQDIFSASP